MTRDEDEGSAVRFANHLWIDWIANWANPKKAMFTIVGISITPYFLGLAISYHYDDADRFLNTLGFVLGSIGLALTLTIISYGSYYQYKIYYRLLRCFDMSATERQHYTLSVIERHSNHWQHIRTSIAVFVIGMIMLYSSAPNYVPKINNTNSISVSFPYLSEFARNGWYEIESIDTFRKICIVYIISMSPALGTSASLILRMPKLLWEISKKRPIFPPSLIKIHFAPAAKLYMIVSISWLFGFFMMAYLFIYNRDIISISLLLFIMALGLVNFLIPQLTYIKVVDKAEDECLDYLADLVNNEGADTDNHLPWNRLKGSQRQEADLILQMTKHDNWVYPLHQTYGIVLIYIASTIAYLSSKFDLDIKEFFGL